FTLKGSVPEAELYSLTFGKPVNANTPAPTYFLYLENSKINITGDLKAIEKLKVTGSSSHNDFLVFQKRFDPLFKEINTRATEINNMQPSLKRDSLLTVYNSTREKIGKEIEKFVKEKPHSIVSPFVLFV